MTSVVILNWNGKKYLEQFLPVLLTNTQNPNTEIVIADNASTDDSLAFLKADFPEIKTIILDKNYGFAEGYNKALKQLDSRYYILLNSDVEVSKNWTLPLIEHMDAHPEVAACQPKIRSYHRKNYFEHAGAAGGFIDKYGYPFCRGRMFDTIEQDEGQYGQISEIFWASGACMMIRAEKFWEMKGFDPVFFAHMEEIDLCWRLQNKNYKISYVPESLVYHIGGGTLNAENPYKTFLNFRNNLLMLYKNLPKKTSKKTMFVRALFDYIAAFQYLTKNQIENAKAVLKARKQYKKLRKQYRSENSEKSPPLKLNKNIYPKSIVIAYHLKGIKKFSELKPALNSDR